MDDGNTPRVFGLYVARSGLPNFEIGRRKSVWGAREKGRLADARPGDRLFFAASMSRLHADARGYPRVGTAREFEGVAAFVCWATVTSEQYIDHAEVWPDDAYPSRVAVDFDTPERDVRVTVERFGNDLLDAVRKSASGSGRLYRAGNAIPPAARPVIRRRAEPRAELSAEPSAEPRSKPRASASLAEVVEDFSDKVWDANIRFGPRAQHFAFVRTFIASLATRRFVILTGMSGSGKTQIAKQFGDWLGHDRHEVVPVRPDWTGAEAIFGFENMLQPAGDGRPSYHVPRALDLILRASMDSANPWLLTLDEMNLAHVERYFADMLSGTESGQPCLPDLERQHGGTWTQRSNAGQPAFRTVPTNLCVVGTVNVDETTYMFSPKVLDRAQTIEFRVPTSALPSTLDQLSIPQAVAAAESHLAAGFLDIAQDPAWHADRARHLPWADELLSHLRAFHALLSPHNFEFGHRVFHEAVRFATIWSAAGSAPSDDDLNNVLDRIVMQKMLPRLHGSLRRLEAPLDQLAKYCFNLGEDAALDVTKVAPDEAALPIAFDKILRMLARVRADHFTSFAE